MTEQDPIAPAKPLHSAVNDLCGRLNLTGDQLAGRFGKNRRTLYKWEDEGCPFDSEDAIRSWCASTKPRMWMKPPEPAFGDLMRPTGDGTKSAPIAPAGQEDARAADGTAPAPATPLSPAQRQAAATADLRLLQSTKAQLDIDTHNRLYLHRDEVRAVMGGLGTLLVGELTELPLRTIELLPADVPADHRTAIRRAVQAAVDGLRGTLTPTLRQRLEQLLAGNPGDAA